jgi:hypothetical protein
MLKAIAAGAALICAAPAWLIFGSLLAARSPHAAFTPETVGMTVAVMLTGGLALIVVSPFIGLFNWARK